MTMIQDNLLKLGFSAKEIEIYLAILQNGKLTPTTLAKLTRINRTTVYSVAKELVQKGLIAEDLGNNTLYLVAKPPQDLDKLIAQEEKVLQERKNIISQTISELDHYTDKSKYSIPKIIFVPEEDLERHLYKQSPSWNESILKYDGTWWGFQDHNFVQHYEPWINWYWEQATPKIKSLKLLSNETAEQIKAKKFPKRHIQFWDGSKNFTATTWVNGDYLIMIRCDQRPYYLVEIHDAVLAHNMRAVFKGIWQGLK